MAPRTVPEILWTLVVGLLVLGTFLQMAGL